MSTDSSLIETAPTNPIVVIADTDGMSRRLVARALVRHELEIIEASDGGSVLDLIRTRPVAAVITDAELPDFEAAALCHSIRALPGTSCLPVLVIDACGDPDTVERVYAAGATDYADKPLNLAALGHRLRHLLRAGHAMRTLEETVAELDRHRERLQLQVFVDELTGLPNRAAFLHHLAACLTLCRDEGEPLAVLFLDLDGFKSVNDTLGHAAGDVLLATIAGRLRYTLRSGDGIASASGVRASISSPHASSMVARLAGDEFTLMLRGISNITDAEQVAERLIDTVGEPVLFEGQSMRVTPSIGIAGFPADGTDMDELLRHADDAMYAAKRAGKNRYHRHDTRAA